MPLFWAIFYCKKPTILKNTSFLLKKKKQKTKKSEEKKIKK